MTISIGEILCTKLCPMIQRFLLEC